MLLLSSPVVDGEGGCKVSPLARCWWCWCCWCYYLQVVDVSRCCCWCQGHGHFQKLVSEWMNELSTLELYGAGGGNDFLLPCVCVFLFFYCFIWLSHLTTSNDGSLKSFILVHPLLFKWGIWSVWHSESVSMGHGRGSFFPTNICIRTMFLPMFLFLFLLPHPPWAWCIFSSSSWAHAASWLSFRFYNREKKRGGWPWF